MRQIHYPTARSRSSPLSCCLGSSCMFSIVTRVLPSGRNHQRSPFLCRIVSSVPSLAFWSPASLCGATVADSWPGARWSTSTLNHVSPVTDRLISENSGSKYFYPCPHLSRARRTGAACGAQRGHNTPVVRPCVQVFDVVILLGSHRAAHSVQSGLLTVVVRTLDLGDFILLALASCFLMASSTSARPM